MYCKACSHAELNISASPESDNDTTKSWVTSWAFDLCHNKTTTTSKLPVVPSKNIAHWITDQKTAEELGVVMTLWIVVAVLLPARNEPDVGVALRELFHTVNVEMITSSIVANRRKAISSEWRRTLLASRCYCKVPLPLLQFSGWFLENILYATCMCDVSHQNAVVKCSLLLYRARHDRKR